MRTAGDPLALVPAVRTVLSERDPELVLYRPEPLATVVGQGLAQRTFALSLMLAFAGVAVGLAAVGIYGVLAHAVTQGRHEIGVRMALGASSGRIRAMVVRRGLWLASLGAVLGLGAALVLTRWLRALVFEISVTDPGVLALGTVTVLLTAAAAGLIPALKATNVAPRAVLEE